MQTVSQFLSTCFMCIFNLGIKKIGDVTTESINIAKVVGKTDVPIKAKCDKVQSTMKTDLANKSQLT